MARICCLGAVDLEGVALLSAALGRAGEEALALLGGLNVPELAKLAPDILIVDLDRLDVDPLEMLRRLRFVLPGCIIIVYTAILECNWARDCHLAGANGLLSKASGEAELVLGLVRAIRNGCWTDPRLVA